MRKFAAAVLVVGLFCLVGTSPTFAGYVDHYTITDDVGQYKAPNEGTSHILVIRVQVNDKPYDWAPWEAFFDNDAPGFTFRNYYNRLSLGRFDPIVTLTDPIEYPSCPDQFNNPSLFPGCSISRGDPMALLPGLNLIHELFDRLKAEQPWINLSDFDINGQLGMPDGWLDGVILMSNLDFTGIALPTSVLYNVDITWDLCNDLLDGLSPYLGGIPINPDEVCPQLVGLSPEELAQTPPFNMLYLLESDNMKVGMVGIASTMDSEVIPAHEFGHVLGFADLYREHYAGEPPETRYIPGLKYSLMGSYGSVGMPLLDGFSRVRIGWGNPIEIKGTMQVTIPPVIDSGVVYYFRTGNEMFFIENRGPVEEYDTIFTKNGLAVYHVDLTREPDTGPFGFIFMILDCVNCDDWQPLIMNEQADGLFELQRGMYWTAGDNDLFHTGGEFPAGPAYWPPPSPTNLVFNSNTYNGRYSGFSITDIDSDSDAPNIKVTFSDGTWSAPIPAAPAEDSGTTGGCAQMTTAGFDLGALFILAPIFVIAAWRRMRK